ncbi:MAG: sigma 54-interacting transcriptional regulator [Bacillota bacterium]
MPIDCFSFQKGLPHLGGYPLVLVSSVELTSDVARQVARGTDILVVRRTIRRDSWERLMALPPGTRAMVVNEDQLSAAETVALLYELGAKHLELVPVYPGMHEPPHLDLAITPGEPQLVPPGVRILDIGDRVVDGTTVVDILTKFGLFDEAANRLVSNHMSRTIPRSPGLWATLGRLADMRTQLEHVLSLVRDGVVAFDREGRVTLLNRRAEQIMGRKAISVLGTPVAEVIPEVDVGDVLGQGVHVEDVVVRHTGKNLVVSKAPLEREGRVLGGVITLREASEIEQLETRLRAELRSKGHVARYTFSDIEGESPAIRAVVRQAQRMAAGSGAVLILGESGTGKELLAHAIHNASPRRNFPFLAVNCAALPESLLESELFGYEEGAFTGARRGGKPGFFEEAHRGTIFLDEIGDMPPQLQARLLRVLQQKEIVRVGGTRVIPVDVRVIAASNRDLRQLVAQGLFRSDLYYRLNVLPLYVPPLRERKADIAPLVEYFLRTHKAATKIAREIMDAFQRYDWPGNVRELENCIEYLVNVVEGDPSARDLPEPIKAAVLGTPTATALQGDPRVIKVLGLLGEAESSGRRLGRRTLAQSGLGLSEHELRLLLKQLERAGLVSIGRGRNGTRLTSAGRELLASASLPS